MKERPILFRGEMVRAILSGKKTQTRRVVSGTERYLTWNSAQPALPNFREDLPGATAHSWILQRERGPLQSGGWQPIHCPQGAPGDRLWVRETMAIEPNERRIIYKEGRQAARYRIGKEFELTGDRWFQASNYEPEKWRPSIFMPRWASRIILEVKSLRVQRVQSISGEDIKAEGVTMPRMPADPADDYPDPWEVWADLWNSINAKPKPVKGGDGEISHYESFPFESENLGHPREFRGKPWHVYGNPWVWVIEFRKLDQ